MPESIVKLLPFLAFFISLHPIFTIATQPYFGCKVNTPTFYTSVDNISIFAHKPWVIVASIILFFIFIITHLFLFCMPLLLLTWISFIRDRFKSISRGLGAPGYFSFFTILSISILEFANSIEFFNNTFYLNIYTVFISIVYAEFGFTFLSAGLFKLIDSKENSLSFAMGMMNPMWSKIHSQFQIIRKFEVPINYLGPINQLIGGGLILSGVFALQTIGLIIIVLTFLFITPLCKLAWLCPSISILSLYLLSNLATFNLINLYIFYLFIMLRGILFAQLFIEYFSNNSLQLHFFSRVINKYRKLMGVIIWKVFTYDIVKYVAPAPGYSSYSDKGNFSNDPAFDIINFNSYHSNVYHAIAISSFLSSQKYIDNISFNQRLNQYLNILKLESLPFLQLSKGDFANCQFQSNPFYDSKLIDLKPEKFKNQDSNLNYQSDFDSYLNN